MTRTYLAGPEVYLPDAIPIGERKKALCLQYGFEGVFPLDNVVDLTARPPRSGSPCARTAIPPSGSTRAPSRTSAWYRYPAGWDVQRFWVYEVRDDLEGCVQRVRQWVTQQQ